MKGDEKDAMKPNKRRSKLGGRNGILLSLALVIIGVVFTLVLATLSMVNYSWPSEISESAVTGIGIGFIVVGVLLLFLYRKMEDPTYAKEMAVLGTDERNVMINYKARAKAFDIVLLTVCVLFAISMIFSVAIQLILPLNFILVVGLLSNLLLQRKYKKEM